MAPKAMEVEFAQHCAYVDLYGNSTTWGTFRKYLQIVHVIKPSSPFTMFYHLMQPSESFTSIVSTKDPHQLIFDDKFFFDNFDVAWRGYEFALHIREKIRTGDATIFPVISEGAR